MQVCVLLKSGFSKAWRNAPPSRFANNFVLDIQHIHATYGQNVVQYGQFVRGAIVTAKLYCTANIITGFIFIADQLNDLTYLSVLLVYTLGMACV